jgi:hypothetical protein
MFIGGVKDEANQHGGAGRAGGSDSRAGEEIGYLHSPWSALPILSSGFGATPYDPRIFLAGCGEWTCRIYTGPP